MLQGNDDEMIGLDPFCRAMVSLLIDSFGHGSMSSLGFKLQILKNERCVLTIRKSEIGFYM